MTDDSLYFVPYEDKLGLIKKTLLYFTYRELIDSLRELLKQRKQVIYLDVGCSSGILVKFISTCFAEEIQNKSLITYGLDINEKLVEYASKKNIYSIFKVASAEKMPFPDNSFDLISSNHIIEHIPNPEKLISEVSRMLNKGGKFFLSCPNSASLVSWLKKESWHSHPSSFPEHLSLLDFANLRSFLKKHNLSIEKEGTTLFTSISNTPFRVRDNISKLILSIFGTMLPWPLGESYKSIARK